MDVFFVGCLSFFILHFLNISVSAHAPNGTELRASSPPRGWNSYDSFCWTISEEEFLESAEIVSQRLKTYGYEYVVVDYLWYRKKVPGAYVDSLGYDVIDDWGRMMPDPGRWPSSAGGRGFTEVASKVHNMGLKFGIHVMAGISTQAVNANTLILDRNTGSAYVKGGRQWRAHDIALKDRACAWMTHGFMSVNTNLEAGKAFLRSLYEQYAEWGIDFVKHDCVFGDDLNLDEITYVSDVLQKLHRPILYSLSPGTSVTPAMAQKVSGLANMYRITGDDWDNWADVIAHFDVSRDMAAMGMIGANSWSGNSWPDLDMLPLGWLTNQGSNEGPHRSSRLSFSEQRTQMTLWGIAKSPLMFGGDLRKLDNTTFNLITKSELLAINTYSTNNKEFPHVTGSTAVKEKSLSGRLRGLPEDAREPDIEVLGMTSCEDPKTKSWSVNVMDQSVERICWEPEGKGSKGQPLCLYKRKHLLTSDEQTILHRGKLQLSASSSMDICLDVAQKRKLTAREFTRGRFSRCRVETNQMWELNSNGSLVNSYAGQCATVRKINTNAIPGGIRSWVATGRKGEIYLAFFNLDSQKTTISAQVADIGEVLGKDLRDATCRYFELWNDLDLGTVTQTISYTVEFHDAALFVLYC
ncbi:hypothetical protein SAY86_016751 [Trapa natans]|uniref:Alpha-galactosidase n=1 Tax=Trapa natans TaxID=22666 RepID=A0AAN7LPB6_TRANT|nr:hypothetical protein SAY86_016751 [Trapa natans]